MRVGGDLFTLPIRLVRMVARRARGHRLHGHILSPCLFMLRWLTGPLCHPLFLLESMVGGVWFQTDCILHPRLLRVVHQLQRLVALAPVPAAHRPTRHHHARRSFNNHRS